MQQILWKRSPRAKYWRLFRPFFYSTELVSPAKFLLTVGVLFPACYLHKGISKRTRALGGSSTHRGRRRRCRFRSRRRRKADVIAAQELVLPLCQDLQQGRHMPTRLRHVFALARTRRHIQLSSTAIRRNHKPYYPRDLRTRILRLSGPKTILYKAFGLF